MKSALRICLLATFFLAFLPAGQIQADSESSPEDYAIVSEDGQYIFVMLVSDDEEVRLFGKTIEEDWIYRTSIYKSEISFDQYRTAKREPLSLRRKYPCSGLYKNDGSITPIWTVNWYASTVYLYPDMHHLVRRGPWHRRWGNWNAFEGLAYAFYKNGIEFAWFRVKDVVKYTDEIRISVSHYRWEEKMLLDRVSGIFSVTTADHVTYEYDVRKLSGAVTGRETTCTPNSEFVRHSNRINSLPFGIVAVIVGCLIVIAGTIKQTSPSDKSAG